MLHSNIELEARLKVALEHRRQADRRERERFNEYYKLYDRLKQIDEASHLKNYSCLVCLADFFYFEPHTTCANCNVWICRGCTRMIGDRFIMKCPACRVEFLKTHDQDLIKTRAKLDKITSACHEQRMLIDRLKLRIEYYQVSLYGGKRSVLFARFVEVIWCVCHDRHYFKMFRKMIPRILWDYLSYKLETKTLTTDRIKEIKARATRELGVHIHTMSIAKIHA